MNTSAIILLGLALTACTKQQDRIKMEILESTVIDSEISTEESTDKNEHPTEALEHFNPLPYAGEIETLASGFWFVEGPLSRDNGTLLFSDIPANKIYQLDNNGLSIFRNNSYHSNGLFESPNGELFIAEHGNRRIAKMTAEGSQAVVEEFEGNRLNSPNDLVFHSNGDLFFTDPPYGIEEHQREQHQNHVFRYTSEGELSSIWSGPIDSRPNGIALSLDEKTLFVSDTNEAVIRSFTLDENGVPSEGNIFAYVSSVADGMTVDPFGNLYVATVAGIEVIGTTGELWGTIQLPNQPSNCTFGGENSSTLYITAVDSVFSLTFDW